MRSRILIGTLPTLLLMLAPHEAAGQGPRWVMDGAGCVPVQSAIQDDLYIIVAGRIKFKPQKTGSITVMCPVSVGVGSVNRIFVSYLDSSGPGTAAHVVAALRRIRKTDGHVSTVEDFVFNSNNESVTQYSFRGDGPSSEDGHTLDDANFYYYVQVVLVRDNSKDLVEFGGVELTGVVF